METHGNNDFAEVFKNLDKYRISEKNFVICHVDLNPNLFTDTDHSFS